MLTALVVVASLSGGISSDVPYSARLLVEAELPSVNRDQLAAERSKLLSTRPGLGLPITLLSIGGGTSLFFTLIIASLGGLNELGIGVFTVLFVGAAALVVGGVFSLISRLSERKAVDARLQAIDRQIGPAKAGDPPIEDSPPPPPPPPPPLDGADGPPGPPPPPPPPLTLLTF